MRVLVIHYHLRPAGVARVIQRAVQSLADRGVRVAVAIGEPATGQIRPDCPVIVHEGLAYGADPKQHPPDRLVAGLASSAAEVLGGAPDVWHVHNHSLGKNLTVPLLCAWLAEQAYPLLLQPHDFAEDGRPSNYRLLQQGLVDELGMGMDALYPCGPNVMYGFLNGRDRENLLGAGLPEDCARDLPNAVGAPNPLPPPGDGGVYLYPTTGIRRKNLGEFLLLAAVSPPGSRFAVSQSPRNPVERAGYDDWVRFAREMGLPVAFEFGADKASFADVVAASRACLTTSIAEGFGLAFLEPWTMNRCVCGRDLPEITADFRAAQVRLERVYDRFEVVLPPGELEAARERFASAFLASRDSYRRPCPPHEARDHAIRCISDEGTDFGVLDEDLQRSFIRSVLGDADAVESMRPVAEQVLETDDASIAHNAGVIRETYGVAAYGDRLVRLYRDTASGREADGRVEAAKVLDACLRPETFSLLRAD